jgi:hypothetical protein
MTPQLTTIEVTPAAAQMIQQLQERAAAQGKTIEALLRPLVENGESIKNGESAEQPEAHPFYETATPEEWVREFLSWANDPSRCTPGLTHEDVSRESIYEDR